MGGALAVFGAMSIQRKGVPCDLYTWGQPRTGDSDFAKYYTENFEGAYYRFTYRNDPVPLSPMNYALNKHHSGRQIHFYECAHNAFVPYNGDFEDKQFSDMSLWDDHHGYFCLATDL